MPAQPATPPGRDNKVAIRPYSPGDLGALYQVCLQTADSGGDATALYRAPRMPGDIYVAPYVTFEPSLAFVAEDDAGVGGYVLGTLDTTVFENRLATDWWPAVRARYPEPPGDVAATLSALERAAIHDIHHPWTTAADLANRFPSHLHIDLVARLQGRGIGTQLIATFVAGLRERGSRGVHLVVGRGNQRAIGFYRHIGFRAYPASDVCIFTMHLGAPE